MMNLFNCQSLSTLQIGDNFMSDLDDVKRLINIHKRRLSKLKEKEARLGVSTPPEVLTEIEDIEGKIEVLKAKHPQLRDKESGEANSENSLSLKPLSSYNSKQKHLQQRWDELQVPFKSLDKTILQILYDYYQTHLGDPQMNLNNLVKACKANKADVISYLHTLKEKGWVAFSLTEQAESGLVELTSLGRKVAEDRG